MRVAKRRSVLFLVALTVLLTSLWQVLARPASSGLELDSKVLGACQIFLGQARADACDLVRNLGLPGMP